MARTFTVNNGNVVRARFSGIPVINGKGVGLWFFSDTQVGYGQDIDGSRVLAGIERIDTTFEAVTFTSVEPRPVPW